jgi:hypothetical protein
MLLLLLVVVVLGCCCCHQLLPDVMAQCLAPHLLLLM